MKFFHKNWENILKNVLKIIEDKMLEKCADASANYEKSEIIIRSITFGPFIILLLITSIFMLGHEPVDNL